MLFEAEKRSALLTDHEFHGRVYGMNYVLFIWGHFMENRFTFFLLPCNIFARFLILVSCFYSFTHFFKSVGPAMSYARKVPVQIVFGSFGCSFSVT